jgi:hypothetical protein
MAETCRNVNYQIKKKLFNKSLLNFAYLKNKPSLDAEMYWDTISIQKSSEEKCPTLMSRNEARPSSEYIAG